METTHLTILNSILKRNNLDKPNGKLLYQYQVTEAEYLMMTNLLKRVGGNSKSFSRDKQMCALFCLFISEWFRREYQREDGWSWTPIWRILGTEIETPEIKTITFNGLKGYWGLSVNQYRENHNDYLGSLFSNGGLPFKLLSSDSNRFKDLFKTLLFKYDNLQSLGESMEQVVSDYMDRNNFPDVFTKDITVRLIASMVERLFELVDGYKLEQKTDPAGHLDNLFPDWRKGFAIPLDIQTGTFFLNDLLSSAINQRKTHIRLKDKTSISCKHWLSNSELICFHTEVTVSSLLELPEIKQSDLRSGQVEVCVIEGNSLEAVATFGTGYIDINKDIISVKLRTRICQFRRLLPNQPLNLLVIQQQQVLVNREILHSQLPLMEQPIGLSFEEDRWMVCGSGSFSYKADSLRIIIPQSATYDLDATDFFQKEDIVSFENAYHSLTFSGVLTISIGQDDGEEDFETYRISSQNMSLFSEQVSITGNQLQYKTITGQSVFLGMPKIQIPEAMNADLWVGGKLTHQNDCSAAIFGLQTVKMKSSQGVTLFHKRLSILPADFTVNFRPGKTPNEGEVIISSKQPLIVSCAKKLGMLSEIKRAQQSRSIFLSVDDTPPLSFIVEISANLLAEPIRLELPFPSQGILAFDSDGNKLSNQLSERDLLGSRLLLYPALTGAAKYTLILSTSIKNSPYYQSTYTVYEKPLEISLYDLRHQIRAFFSFFDDIDTKLLLEITGPCRTELFTIYKFDCRAIYEDTEIVMDIIRKKVTKFVRPVLMYLADPKKHPSELVNKKTQDVNTDIFILENTPPTPCLVIPAADSELQFRPVFIQGTQIQYVDSVISLYKAVEIFDFNENKHVIRDVLSLMSENFNHTSWQYLIDLFNGYKHLPLSTFMVWKEIVKHPAALCMLTFRIEQAPEIIERLTQEFSIVWEFLPLTLWRNAAQYFKISLSLPDEFFLIVFENKCNRLKDFLSIFHEGSRAQITNGSLTTINQTAMNCAVNHEGGFYQKLMQLHAYDEWPCFFSSELMNWYSKLKTKPLDINIHHKHHISVLLLPIFIGAVTAEKASKDHILTNEQPIDESIFKYQLRRLLEFDPEWFLPIYHYSLQFFSQQDS